MPKYVAVTREQHSAKHWLRYTNYAFAAGNEAASLVLAELSRAVMSLPIAFIQQGENYVPIAVLGLASGKNLFVAPAGQWLGDYIPASLRLYPFRLAHAADGRDVLCFDEDSGLISDGPEGEAFFTENGEPAQAVTEILTVLAQIEKSRIRTLNACRLLARHQLFRPWGITLNTAEGKQEVKGLFQIDEAALNGLPDEAFLELRQNGALLLAYCQLLSMQHIAVLAKLAEAHAKAPAPPPKAELDLEFLKRDGMLHFGNLG